MLVRLLGIVPESTMNKIQ